MNRSVPEILAPAGSMESLIAALRAGADAVYIGGKKYSARNSAANFSVSEITEAAERCHLYGAKLYLAVNTIISDSEISDFCQYIKETAIGRSRQIDLQTVLAVVDVVHGLIVGKIR